MSQSGESQRVMLVDVNSCSGCHACQVACKAEHRAPIGFVRTRVQTVMHGVYPNVAKQFVPTLCQHCVDAPCISACPVNAIDRVDGIVRIDEDRCVSSGECASACPYGAIYLDDEDGRAHKCDFCANRLADGDEPACVATCPTDALHFGYVNETHIATRLAEGGYTEQWEREETRPQVWYKGLHAETLTELRRINGPFRGGERDD